MKDRLLSVVIPAYNEELRIGSTLNQIVNYLESRGLPFELLVVDDGSNDRTAEIARRFAQQNSDRCDLRVLTNDSNRGKGFSVRRGMLEAGGSCALLTDADLSSPIEELPKLEEALFKSGCDIAFGSRDVEGSRVEVHQSSFREGAGKLFNRLVRLATGLPYRDTQCGFKLFRMECCRELFQRQTLRHFAFDVEVLFLARKQGLRLEEVPVVWRHAEGSRVHFVSDALLMLGGLAKVRWNDWMGRYECRATGHR